MHFRSDDSDSKLVSFLARSRPPLESLTVTADFNSEILLDCLRHTPALTSLNVYHRPKLTDADIKMLQLCPNTENNICPGLQNINFESCVENANMKLMVDMVVSRRQNFDVSSSYRMNPQASPARNRQREGILRSIHLGGCRFEEYSSYDSINFASHPEIERCIEEGLEIFEDPDSDSD
ncbi:hypothetical protein BD410DRAFT_635246 [Rickenella mellea]|uniref:F-box domain-containing protein n=1 Tax=Rickenella mellea TaxID=50990 RepID=A0A4Y7QD22_9AGAM|nr:hypothetical protein BD410DRAFT_635246 [Rickenella mellea]